MATSATSPAVTPVVQVSEVVVENSSRSAKPEPVKV